MSMRRTFSRIFSKTFCTTTILRKKRGKPKKSTGKNPGMCRTFSRIFSKTLNMTLGVLHNISENIRKKGGKPQLSVAHARTQGNPLGVTWHVTFGHVISGAFRWRHFRLPPRKCDFVRAHILLSTNTYLHRYRRRTVEWNIFTMYVNFTIVGSVISLKHWNFIQTYTNYEKKD